MIDLSRIRRLDERLASGIRALVVDDDPEHLLLMQTVLEAMGLETVVASDGQMAIEEFEQAAVQLVLTDLRMPGLDGEQLCERLKQMNPAIPVLIITAVDDVESAVKLLKVGADDYIPKPIRPDVLHARVQSVLRILALTEQADQLNELIDRAFQSTVHLEWGNSQAMLAVAGKVPRLAGTLAPVIVYGESGTGKELVARAIHEASRRADGPMISIDCGSIPETMWEREFFGHVKGAFSDSGEGGEGLVAAADGGTLFLDEVGEIPLSQQSKLLRFLQEREYRPLGSTKSKSANVRIVSATNRDLKREAMNGSFRRDLYFRLNVLSIQLPPLRKRKSDIPSLADHFVKKYTAEFDRDVVGLSPRAMAKLCSHEFPGNVRELESIVLQLVLETDSSIVRAEQIPVGDLTISEAPLEGRAKPAHAAVPPRCDVCYNRAKALAVEEFERTYIETLLSEHAGHIGRAADAAQISRRSFSRIMKRHGLSKQAVVGSRS